MVRPIALLLAVTLAALSALGCDVDNDCENGAERMCASIQACGLAFGCPEDAVIDACTEEQGEWSQCYADCFEAAPCDPYFWPDIGALGDLCTESCGEFPDESP
ncbi:MAG: hypothetical protein IPM79_34320 [Polyangiaceae bacterium]|jgi:hypothetical protein|nr:hypothetical protein [Polyangiaceae bacterium]MBK8942537.1 hypothetical protein [Polyangiaceae bacterium]